MPTLTYNPHLPPKRLTLLAIISGFSALMLLPIGLFWGTGELFFLIFLGHFGLLLLAAGTAIHETLLILRNKECGRALCFLLFFGVLALLLIEGSHAITARDALIHHLTVPKLWINQGAIKEIAWHEWSYYPLLTHLGYTGLLGLGLEWFTPYYHALYLVILAPIVASLTLYLTRESSAARGALIFTLITPVFINLASAPLVDLPLSLYTALALGTLLAWGEDSKLKTAAAVGCSLGLALCTKYNALLLTAIIVPLMAVYGIIKKRGWKTAASHSVLAAVIALIVFSPLLLKNFSWTGNPLFPLYNNLWNVPSLSAGTTAPSPINYRKIFYGENTFDLITTPLRMLFMGRDGDPAHFDGVATPLLLLSLFSFFHKERKGAVFSLAAFSILYFIGALASASWRIRYLTPLAPALIPLSFLGIVFISRVIRTTTARAVLYVLILQALLSSLYAAGLLLRSDAVSSLISRTSKTDYLFAHLPEYRVIEEVNKRIDPNRKIYLLYTSNYYYYFSPYALSGGYNSERLLITWLKAAASGDAFFKTLREYDISYLLAHRARTMTALPTLLNDGEKERWNDFLSRHTKELFTLGEYTAWEIL